MLLCRFLFPAYDNDPLLTGFESPSSEEDNDDGPDPRIIVPPLEKPIRDLEQLLALQE